MVCTPLTTFTQILSAPSESPTSKSPKSRLSSRPSLTASRRIPSTAPEVAAPASDRSDGRTKCRRAKRLSQLALEADCSIGSSGHHRGVSADDSNIHTTRLRLRKVTSQDIEAVASLSCDPRVNEHRPGGAPSREQAVQIAREFVEDWRRDGIGYWIVERDGTMVGLAGLKSAELMGADCWNLYYRFSPVVWGQGLAAEATRAALRVARHRDPQRHVVARTRPSNAPARRLALSIGMKREPAPWTPTDSSPSQLPELAADSLASSYRRFSSWDWGRDRVTPSLSERPRPTVPSCARLAELASRLPRTMGRADPLPKPLTLHSPEIVDRQAEL
jgi:ribosomal-protein-alanine N-acetyltransferase